ncbi:hypothetical protein, partial [Vibrio parahaemolyticus]|uniref:hypothetical protein n=1 Tax=Vibrio parahaemolyticus TaxID=670 RepID=UPI002151ADE7
LLQFTEPQPSPCGRKLSPFGDTFNFLYFLPYFSTNHEMITFRYFFARIFSNDFVDILGRD